MSRRRRQRRVYQPSHRNGHCQERVLDLKLIETMELREADRPDCTRYDEECLNRAIREKTDNVCPPNCVDYRSKRCSF